MRGRVSCRAVGAWGDERVSRVSGVPVGCLRARRRARDWFGGVGVITIPVGRQVLAELVALGGCPDCAGGVALLADRVDVNNVARGVRVAVAHSSTACPVVQGLPAGALYLVLPADSGEVVER